MAGLAVFDFDGTVIRGDSVVALLLFARKRGALSRRGLLRAALAGAAYRIGCMDALTAKRKSHDFLAAMPAAERNRLLQDFARSLAGRVYPPALRQIEVHRAAGDIVVLCSASCQCYMRYVAPLLLADVLLCTPSDAEGRTVGPNCCGEEKVCRLQDWMRENGIPSDAPLTAYGDSRSDAPILRMSQHPVLVNAKRGLRKALPDAEKVVWN